MKARVKAEAQLDESIRAFLEIGRERNRLVHQNYGMFTLEKTAGMSCISVTAKRESSWSYFHSL